MMAWWIALGQGAWLLVDLVEHFAHRELAEAFLQSSAQDSIWEALLDVWGLGPWLFDMFPMFSLENLNVLPVGDLGICKGLARHFLLGKCHRRISVSQKDLNLIQTTVQPFEPYQSLLSFYMWRVADTVDLFNSPKKKSPTKKDRRWNKILYHHQKSSDNSKKETLWHCIQFQGQEASTLVETSIFLDINNIKLNILK